jgi:hypothetical protein
VEILELDLPRVEIDGAHGRLVNGRVVLALDEVAQRVTHCRGLEEARCQLVEERLERVVVVAVDQHDVGVRTLSFWAAPTPAKPPPRTTTRGRWAFTAGSPTSPSPTRRLEHE